MIFIFLIPYIFGTEMFGDLETKRREALGITTELIKVPQWTPNGTVYKEELTG